jgi:hypothetical protein
MKSIIHARNRVTGPASVCENTTPSGVLMSKVFVRVMVVAIFGS